jgi:hypothetical protein
MANCGTELKTARASDVYIMKGKRSGGGGGASFLILWQGINSLRKTDAPSLNFFGNLRHARHFITKLLERSCEGRQAGKVAYALVPLPRGITAPNRYLSLNTPLVQTLRMPTAIVFLPTRFGFVGWFESSTRFVFKYMWNNIYFLGFVAVGVKSFQKLASSCFSKIKRLF